MPKMSGTSNSSEMFQLKWSIHNREMVREFYELYKTGSYSDVTIATDDQKSFNCHKIVLSACSPYFRSLFNRTSCKNPVIVLKDITSTHFSQLLRYMYIGEIEVAKKDLPVVLHHANYLQIRGLETTNNEGPKVQQQQQKPQTEVPRQRSPAAVKRSTPEIMSNNHSQVENQRSMFGFDQKANATALLEAAAALESTALEHFKRRSKAGETVPTLTNPAQTTTATSSAAATTSTSHGGSKSRKGYHPKKIRYTSPDGFEVIPEHAALGGSNSPKSDPGFLTEPEASGTPTSSTGANGGECDNNNEVDHDQPVDFSKTSPAKELPKGRYSSILDNMLHRRMNGEDAVESNNNTEDKTKENTKNTSLEHYMNLINGKKSAASPTMVPLQDTLGIDITGRLRQHFLDTLPPQWLAANQTPGSATNPATSSTSGFAGNSGTSSSPTALESDPELNIHEEEEILHGEHQRGRSVSPELMMPPRGRGRGRGGSHRTPASANFAYDEYGRPRLGSNGKPMVRCETCGKELADPSSLYRHRKIHSGEKPHKCPFCPRRFIQRYNMRQHLKTHKMKGVSPKMVARLEPDLQEVFLNNRF